MKILQKFDDEPDKLIVIPKAGNCKYTNFNLNPTCFKNYIIFSYWTVQPVSSPAVASVMLENLMMYTDYQLVVRAKLTLIHNKEMVMEAWTLTSDTIYFSTASKINYDHILYGKLNFLNSRDQTKTLSFFFNISSFFCV